jgi:hypothetical protein
MTVGPAKDNMEGVKEAYPYVTAKGDSWLVKKAGGA